jgi:hypothetical protein
MLVVVRAAMLAALIGVTGCASGARSDHMVTTRYQRAVAGHELYQALTVRAVQGGSETNPLWMSNVSDEEFRRGLERSLRAAGLLATSGADARYNVVSNIQSLDRPLAALDFNVTMSVRYTVTPVVGGAPIFDTQVTTTGVSGASEEFLGSERLRLAIEDAARENISAFMRRLRSQVQDRSVAPAS